MKNTLRSLLEHMARGTTLRRRMPANFGSRAIYLSPDAALQYLKWNWARYSRDLLDAASRFVTPGMVVWDVGANVGVFMLAAAHRVGTAGEVVAVDADPFLASTLHRTVHHGDNRDLNICVLCTGVSNSNSIERFVIARRGRASNSLAQAGARVTAGGARYEHCVPTVTLDMLLDHFRRPEFVKIDVEGAESLVLAGATRLLTHCRPTFYIEVDHKRAEDVTAVFRRHQYRLYDGDARNAKELDRCVFNTLAVPSESGLTNEGS